MCGDRAPARGEVDGRHADGGQLAGAARVPPPLQIESVEVEPTDDGREIIIVCFDKAFPPNFSASQGVARSPVADQLRHPLHGAVERL
jgi:hypothetical protein